VYDFKTKITKYELVYSLKPLWSDLEEAPIPNINEFSQLFSRQAVEPKLAKKKVQLKKKTEVSCTVGDVQSP